MPFEIGDKMLIKLRHPSSLFLAALWLAAMQPLAQERVINTAMLTNEVGSECPTTNVRVESVVPDPNTNRQHLVISIPETLLLNTPNITFHRPDGAALAFTEFRELQSKKDSRRQFGTVLAGNDRIEFKIRFSSETDLRRTDR